MQVGFLGFIGKGKCLHILFKYKVFLSKFSIYLQVSVIKVPTGINP